MVCFRAHAIVQGGVWNESVVRLLAWRPMGQQCIPVGNWLPDENLFGSNPGLLFSELPQTSTFQACPPWEAARYGFSLDDTCPTCLSALLTCPMEPLLSLQWKLGRTVVSSSVSLRAASNGEPSLMWRRPCSHMAVPLCVSMPWPVFIRTPYCALSMLSYWIRAHPHDLCKGRTS